MRANPDGCTGGLAAGPAGFVVGLLHILAGRVDGRAGSRSGTPPERFTSLVFTVGLAHGLRRLRLGALRERTISLVFAVGFADGLRRPRFSGRVAVCAPRNIIGLGAPPLRKFGGAVRAP